MDIEEFKLHCFTGTLGAVKPTKDIRDYKLHFLSSNDSDIPESFELPIPKVIKDQGANGICANASWSYIQEHLNELKTNSFVELSPTYIYAHKSDPTCSGMELREVLQLATKIGLCENSLFPYIQDVPDIINDLNNSDQSKLDENAAQYKPLQYVKLDTDVDVKRAMMKYGYIYGGIEWFEDNGYSSIDNPNSTYGYDVLINEGTQSVGYHALIRYGWDKNGWKGCNTWGSWAKDGLAIFDYNYQFLESWGVIGEILEPDQKSNPTPIPVIIKPSDNVIYQFIAKIVNWIINLFKKK